MFQQLSASGFRFAMSRPQVQSQNRQRQAHNARPEQHRDVAPRLSCVSILWRETERVTQLHNGGSHDAKNRYERTGGDPKLHSGDYQTRHADSGARCEQDPTR